VGEAGIGKSRLVAQFRERLTGTPHTWNECAGASHFQNTPFYPVTDMLQPAFAQRGDATDREKLSELERVLELAGLKPAEAVPLVAPILNILVGEKYNVIASRFELKRECHALRLSSSTTAKMAALAGFDVHQLGWSHQIKQLLRSDRALMRQRK
jgi:predicted ATPase